MNYLGRIALLAGLAIAALQVVTDGKEALPLLVIALLITGLALTLARDDSAQR